MKLFFVSVFFFLAISSGFAQSKKNVYFDHNTLVKKFHTIDELEGLKKGQLIALYIDRVREVITILPYLALTNKPGVSLSDGGIKETPNNLKVLDKHHQAIIKSSKETSDMISEFVPYADTEKIVWSILYFEDVIKKTRIGTSGNY